ncbi:class I SAM-dependent methyltransferase [Actinoplanes sp. CA-030573]|uniref:class I SAM-dependent methyltransferase n=1 Tax=Actinoplanes sp. CA-030573 TaxID=3239898 RepID=UPI003D8AC0D0
MSDVEDRNPALVFGETAAFYDRVRPAYPAALIDDVLAVAGSEVRALEVGAGSGRATAAFVARGVPVTAIEPDPAMAGLLAARCPGAELFRGTFEQFRPAERFGLLYSAEAWHWTDPATRWSRATDALAEGGTLALFWNTERIDDPARWAAMLRVYADLAPAVVFRDAPVHDGPDASWAPTSRRYLTRRAMPAADYLGLAQTRSQFRMLPAPVRPALLEALTALFDDEVPLAIETTLVLGTRPLEP